MTTTVATTVVTAAANVTKERREIKVMYVITDIGGAERMLVSYLTDRSSAPACFVVSLLSGGVFAEWPAGPVLPSTR